MIDLMIDIHSRLLHSIGVVGGAARGAAGGAMKGAIAGGKSCVLFMYIHLAKYKHQTHIAMH